MKLEKPLVFFDIESAVPGLNPDPAKDRIVSLATLRLEPDFPDEQRSEFLFNPEMEMSPPNIAIHGITNEQAKTGHTFRNYGKLIIGFFTGCDLAGFNILNYDVPLLWEEFYRAGITWDLNGVNIVDVSNIFRKKEERTLSAAVKFYLGQYHTDAHMASGDTTATLDVLRSQLLRYPELNELSVSKLSEFSAMDKRLDLAGRIVLNEQGEAVYAIGKAKGTRVIDDPGFGRWMLKQDFSQNTKQVIQEILRKAGNERL